jgi:hypothetical protein
MDWWGMNESEEENKRGVCMYMMRKGDKKEGSAFAFLQSRSILDHWEWRITWMGVNGSNECGDCY